MDFGLISEYLSGFTPEYFLQVVGVLILLAIISPFIKKWVEESNREIEKRAIALDQREQALERLLAAQARHANYIEQNLERVQDKLGNVVIGYELNGHIHTISVRFKNPSSLSENAVLAAVMLNSRIIGSDYQLRLFYDGRQVAHYELLTQNVLKVLHYLENVLMEDKRVVKLKKFEEY